jgi:hypothetical protein
LLKNYRAENNALLFGYVIFIMDKLHAKAWFSSTKSIKLISFPNWEVEAGFMQPLRNHRNPIFIFNPKTKNKKNEPGYSVIIQCWASF